jgi:glycosyltransferase involved in cell wall biosynthesis
MKKVSLSVLVPVFNERALVAASLERLKALSGHPTLSNLQVIVVDDGSTDGSAEVLRAFEAGTARGRKGVDWLFLRHPENRGKGAAVSTALERATGEFSVVHDADLEYHPRDIPALLAPVLEDGADAVYGSRFANSRYRRVLFFRHEVGNRLLTLLCDLASNLNLTDIETCYKVIRTELFRSIPLESNDFRMEPEITLKLAKRGAKIFEVPISYSGRSYQEGKKITYRDGFLALWAILRFSLSSNIRRTGDAGKDILDSLAEAPRFNRWMADVIRPYLGESLLETGAGRGNLTAWLLPRRRYQATDLDPAQVEALARLGAGRSGFKASVCDLSDPASFPRPAASFDTAVCLNVLEHMEDDLGALKNLARSVRAGGRVVVLVPQGRWLQGSLDRVLGHQRRYSRDGMRALALASGLEVEALFPFNRAGVPAWFVNSKLLKRERFSRLQVKALNALTPLFRLLEPALPLPGLSLVLVGRKPLPHP